MKTLLVPTDFSHEAGAGVEYAAAFAGKGDFKIILLHAFHLNTVDILYTQMVPATHSFKDSAHDQLLLTRDLISDKVKLQPECVFEEGSLNDVISKTVNEKKIDYIIMGTRGAKGIKKLLRGSHTSGIIRNALCPVISVPQNIRFQGFKKVCFATNYHRDDIAELHSIVDLVKPYKALIKVIHAAEMDENRIEQIMYAFEKNARKQIHYPHFYFGVLKGNDLQETLHDYLNAEKPDLFSISTGFVA